MEVYSAYANLSTLYATYLNYSDNVGAVYRLGWGRVGFGNMFFHVMTSVHEAASHRAAYVVCREKYEWEYPWPVTDLFYLQYQTHLVDCKDLKYKLFPGRKIVGHSMAFWNTPYSYKPTTDFYYWKFLIQKHFRPSQQVWSDTRKHVGLLGMPSVVLQAQPSPFAGKISNDGCSVGATFQQSFARCVLYDLFPDADSWPKPWIGVHVRASDSLPDVHRPPVKVQTLADVLRYIPSHIQRGTILLATDSPEVLEGFGTNKEWTVQSIPENRTRYTANSEVLIEMRTDLDRGIVMMDLILDIGLLTQADILVLPMYGSFARMIAALSKPTAVIVSSDGSRWCPFAACDAGRTDDKFCKNGGFVGSYYNITGATKYLNAVPRSVLPLWNISTTIASGVNMSRDACLNASKAATNMFEYYPLADDGYVHFNTSASSGQRTYYSRLRTIKENLAKITHETGGWSFVQSMHVLMAAATLIASIAVYIIVGHHTMK
jgi:hypothetical protein